MESFEKTIDELTHVSQKLKDDILDIESDEDNKGKQKSNLISELIINFLKKHGTFIKSETNFYYFNKIDKKLYAFTDTNFSYILSKYSWINKQEYVFRFILNAIEVEIFDHWKDVKIKKFSHYRKSTNSLYIFNNWNKIIKITEKDIIEINNGDEWIVFLWNDYYSEWGFKKDLSWYKDDLLWNLISSMSLQDWHLTKKEQEFILYQYILCLFFPSLLNNRGVITFVWEKWSWKTFFLEILLLIFTGKDNSISNLPTKEDDLKVNLLNEYFCYFDNVDDKVANSKIDLLCSVATGASIKVRKLYTNSEQINTKVNCFVWITSRNPTFKRDDFADRMLLFFLKRRDWFSSDSTLKDIFDTNRDQIMSRLCFDLQAKLKGLKNIEEYPTNFRLSDFSNLIKNLNKWDEEKIESMLMKLQLNQQELATQTDTLLDLIKELLENSKHIKDWEIDAFIEWKKFKASDLNRLFSSYSRSNPHLKYSFNSPMTLWRVLSNNISSYKNIHWILIEITQGRSNQKFYAITKIKEQD